MAREYRNKTNFSPHLDPFGERQSQKWHFDLFFDREEQYKNVVRRKNNSKEK